MADYNDEESLETQVPPEREPAPAPEPEQAEGTGNEGWEDRASPRDVEPPAEAPEKGVIPTLESEPDTGTWAEKQGRLKRRMQSTEDSVTAAVKPYVTPTEGEREGYRQVGGVVKKMFDGDYAPAAAKSFVLSGASWTEALKTLFSTDAFMEKGPNLIKEAEALEAPEWRGLPSPAPQDFGATNGTGGSQYISPVQKGNRLDAGVPTPGGKSQDRAPVSAPPSITQGTYGPGIRDMRTEDPSRYGNAPPGPPPAGRPRPGMGPRPEQTYSVANKGTQGANGSPVNQGQRGQTPGPAQTPGPGQSISVGPERAIGGGPAAPQYPGAAPLMRGGNQRVAPPAGTPAPTPGRAPVTGIGKNYQEALRDFNRNMGRQTAEDNKTRRANQTTADKREHEAAVDKRALERSERGATNRRDAEDRKYFQKILEDAGDDEEKVKKLWQRYAPDRPIPGRTMEESRPNTRKSDPGFFDKAVKYLFGSGDEEAPEVKAQAPAKQQGGALPPEAVQQLREGKVTTFNNGSRWTIRGGQPTQVQ